MGLFAGTQWDRPSTCEKCGALEKDCQCPPPPPKRKPPQKQTANISVEKRKKGKVVTVVSGLNSNDYDLPELFTKLKSACGAGGALKDDTLEIQGKHVEAVREILAKIGFRVKGYHGP